MGTLLIVIGMVLFVVGLAKIGAGQSGGFNNVLKNFGINFGGSITEVNRQGNVSSTPANGEGLRLERRDHRRAWSGLCCLRLGA
jgi:hypothetical protein